MKRRFAIMLAAFAVSASVALGQGKLGPHVVDSNGQRIGYFIGLGSAGDEAVVSIDGVSFRIRVVRDGFVTGDVPNIFNTEADCSGQDYVSVQSAATLLESAWFTTDGFFHYPASEGFVIINGTRVMHGDGSFGPCSAVGPTSSSVGLLLSTQAPALTPPFLVVDAYPVSPPPSTATFNDVPTSHPFFQFIEALHASGITGGCQAVPPLYCPDNPVTRGQMAVFLAKALGL